MTNADSFFSRPTSEAASPESGSSHEGPPATTSLDASASFPPPSSTDVMSTLTPDGAAGNYTGGSLASGRGGYSEPYAAPSYPDPVATSGNSYPVGGYPVPYPAAVAVPMYPVPAYPPAGYPGYSAALPDHPLATLVLVLGLVSLIIPPVAPFAWGIGSSARAEIREIPPRYRSSGSLTTGWVIGIIITIAMILAAVGSLLVWLLLLSVVNAVGS